MSVVELATSRIIKDPKQVLQGLVSSCDTLSLSSHDVYGDYNATPTTSWLRAFECEIAAYFGKENALFSPSGTMAQGIALKVSEENRSRLDVTESSSHVEAASRFLVHHTSHVLLHENRNFDVLYRMEPIIISSNPDSSYQQPMRYADVDKSLKQAIEGGQPLPHTVLLEVPHREIGGKCTPYDDIEQISSLCKKLGIHLHMDGARIWEASGSQKYDIHHTNNCQEIILNISKHFDSIYVSFYKGLGGITGAMLLGTNDFISKARVWQRRFGGNLYSLMPYGVSCWQAFRDNKDSFWNRRIALTNVVLKLSELFVDQDSSSLIHFDPPIPEVSMIHVYIHADEAICMQARDKTLKDVGISCFNRIRASNSREGKSMSCFELNMGPDNMKIPVEVWVTGWSYFLRLVAISLEK